MTATFEHRIEEASKHYGDPVLRQVYKEGAVAERLYNKRLVEVLVVAKLAVEALALSQKQVGMGLLGELIVAPHTLKLIDDVLADHGVKA